MGDPAAVAPPGDPVPPPRLAKTRVARALWVAAGSVALALGVIGIFVRGFLPTTPFLLLAAYCYSRGSARLYRWIYGHRTLGPILLDWERERSLAMRTKTVGIAAAWLGILISITVLHFTAPAGAFAYLFVFLLLVATFVTFFLSTRRTSFPTARADAERRALERDARRRSRSLGLGGLLLGVLGGLGVFRIAEGTFPDPILVATVLAVATIAAVLILVLLRVPAMERAAQVPPQDRTA